MKINYYHNRLELLVLWFVKLRWIAISALILFLVIAKIGFNLPILLLPNLIVLGVLILNNILTSVYIQKMSASIKIDFIPQKWLINIQIISDLILLSVILHYSGSIENPFIAVYLLHIVLAAIMLPLKESFIIAFIANILIGGLVILEYKAFIPHYSPIGFESYKLYQNIKFILLTGFVFSIMSFVILYFTSSITKQLRENQIKFDDLMNLFKEQAQDKNKYVVKLLKKIRNRYELIAKQQGELHKKPITSELIQKESEFISFLDKLGKLTDLRLVYALGKTKINFKELFYKTLDSIANSDIKNSITEEITDNFYTASVVLNLKLSDGIERSIPLTYTIEKRIKFVNGNEDFLQSMMYQLLHNAIKFNTAGGQIYFKARAVNKKLRIEIYDTGRGIVKNEQSMVFDDFFKGKLNDNINEDGNGLGLSLANEVVKKHNGRIWFDSKKGKGTKFNLELPVLASE